MNSFDTPDQAGRTPNVSATLASRPDIMQVIGSFPLVQLPDEDASTDIPALEFLRRALGEVGMSHVSSLSAKTPMIMSLMIDTITDIQNDAEFMQMTPIEQAKYLLTSTTMQERFADRINAYMMEIMTAFDMGKSVTTAAMYFSQTAFIPDWEGVRSGYAIMFAAAYALGLKKGASQTK